MPKPNNNPKDRESLLKFQKRQLELDRITKDRARKETIKDNVAKWVSLLPNHMKNANPSNILPETLEKLKNLDLRAPYEKKVLICGKNPNHLKFLSNVIVFALINSGKATPSQIKRTSLIDGYNNINGMFASRNWKDKFFNRNSKVLIIEGCSKSTAYLGMKGEEQFWRELDDFTREQDILVILQYTTEQEELEKEILIPTISADDRFNKGIIMSSTFLKLTENEEKNIETKQRSIN